MRFNTGFYDPLEIGGALIKIDTNDFDSRVYEEAINKVVQAYGSNSGS